MNKFAFAIIAIMTIPVGGTHATENKPAWTAVNGGTCKIWNYLPDSPDSRTITWTGICPKGIAQGFGELRVVWKNGIAVNETFVGNLRDGREEGKGMSWTDDGKSSFMGQWKDGKINGFAVDRYENRITSGNYVDGLLQGPVTTMFAKGSPRHGDAINSLYKDGERQGTSIYRFKSGRIFIGTLNSDWIPEKGRYIAKDQ